MRLNYIDNIDCLVGMKEIPDGSVDMILCDLPYGTTRNKWDSIIPFDALWSEWDRVCKTNAAIVLFSQQPFTSNLVQSRLELFRYEWIWEKTNPTGFLHAKKMPLKYHENICVFYKKLPTYNPQFTKGKPYKKTGDNTDRPHYRPGITRVSKDYSDGKRYPRDIITASNSSYGLDRGLHPTQKPVALCEYLIKTYTNPGDVVLDNCMGSGTTAVACIRSNRNFIGFELDEQYHTIALQRVAAEQEGAAAVYSTHKHTKEGETLEHSK